MGKIKDFISKKDGKFYKTLFIISLVIIISLLSHLHSFRQVDKERMVYSTSRYMESLQVFSSKAAAYLEDPTDEELLLGLNKMSSDMGSFIKISAYSKSNKYRDLESALVKLAKLNFEVTFLYFPQVDDGESKDKIENFIKANSDLYDFYKTSESGLPGEGDFKNYKSLLEKVQETNEKIISDFAIEDEMLKGQQS